jgi:hypothetical protein
MKFSEIMDLLKSGSRVTREKWKDGVCFIYNAPDVISLQPRVTHFQYNESIMISEGWTIDTDYSKEYKFSEIIPFLMKGSIAKLKEWKKDNYIYLDKPTKMLVFHSMETFPFIPDFESFIAEDWIEL